MVQPVYCPKCGSTNMPGGWAWHMRSGSCKGKWPAQPLDDEALKRLERWLNDDAERAQAQPSYGVREWVGDHPITFIVIICVLSQVAFWGGVLFGSR